MDTSVVTLYSNNTNNSHSDLASPTNADRYSLVGRRTDSNNCSNASLSLVSSSPCSSLSIGTTNTHSSVEEIGESPVNVSITSSEEATNQPSPKKIDTHSPPANPTTEVSSVPPYPCDNYQKLMILNDEQQPGTNKIQTKSKFINGASLDRREEETFYSIGSDFGKVNNYDNPGDKGFTGETSSLMSYIDGTEPQHAAGDYKLGSDTWIMNRESVKHNTDLLDLDNNNYMNRRNSSFNSDISYQKMRHSLNISPIHHIKTRTSVNHRNSPRLLPAGDNNTCDSFNNGFDSNTELRDLMNNVNFNEFDCLINRMQESMPSEISEGVKSFFAQFIDVFANKMKEKRYLEEMLEEKIEHFDKQIWRIYEDTEQQIQMEKSKLIQQYEEKENLSNSELRRTIQSKQEEIELLLQKSMELEQKIASMENIDTERSLTNRKLQEEKRNLLRQLEESRILQEDLTKNLEQIQKRLTESKNQPNKTTDQLIVNHLHAEKQELCKQLELLKLYNRKLMDDKDELEAKDLNMSFPHKHNLKKHGSVLGDYFGDNRSDLQVDKMAEPKPGQTKTPSLSSYASSISSKARLDRNYYRLVKNLATSLARFKSHSLVGQDFLETPSTANNGNKNSQSNLTDTLQPSTNNPIGQKSTMSISNAAASPNLSNVKNVSATKKSREGNKIYPKAMSEIHSAHGIEKQDTRPTQSSTKLDQINSVSDIYRFMNKACNSSQGQHHRDNIVVKPNNQSCNRGVPDNGSSTPLQVQSAWDILSPSNNNQNNMPGHDFDNSSYPNDFTYHSFTSTVSYPSLLPKGLNSRLPKGTASSISDFLKNLPANGYNRRNVQYIDDSLTSLAGKWPLSSLIPSEWKIPGCADDDSGNEESGQIASPNKNLSNPDKPFFETSKVEKNTESGLQNDKTNNQDAQMDKSIEATLDKEKTLSNVDSKNFVKTCGQASIANCVATTNTSSSKVPRDSVTYMKLLENASTDTEDMPPSMTPLVSKFQSDSNKKLHNTQTSPELSNTCSFFKENEKKTFLSSISKPPNCYSPKTIKQKSQNLSSITSNRQFKRNNTIHCYVNGVNNKSRPMIAVTPLKRSNSNLATIHKRDDQITKPYHEWRVLPPIPKIKSNRIKDTNLTKNSVAPIKKNSNYGPPPSNIAALRRTNEKLMSKSPYRNSMISQNTRASWSRSNKVYCSFSNSKTPLIRYINSESNSAGSNSLKQDGVIDGLMSSSGNSDDTMKKGCDSLDEYLNNFRDKDSLQSSMRSGKSLGHNRNLSSNLLVRKKLSQDPKRVFKIILIGDVGVGKSTFIHMACHKQFCSTFLPTIGLDFQVKSLVVNEQLVALQLWDTAGQERFKTLTRHYYRKADAIILMYDITKPKTLTNLRGWITEIQKHLKCFTNEPSCCTVLYRPYMDDLSMLMEQNLNKPVFVIVANKMDLIRLTELTVASDELYLLNQSRNLANDIEALHFDVSSKTGQNIEQAFVHITRMLCKTEDLMLRTPHFSALTLEQLTRNDSKPSNCSSCMK